MIPKQMKAVVSEINKVKKNQKPDNNQPGGIIDKEMIETVLRIKLKNTSKNEKIKSPGMMKKHYSPGIPVIINQSNYDGKSAFIYLGKRFKNKKHYFSLCENLNLNQAASNLYKVFRLIKRKGYKKIQIVRIPNSGSGVAINDRIKRASKT